jgi:hypothetical protein
MCPFVSIFQMSGGPYFLNRYFEVKYLIKSCDESHHLKCSRSIRLADHALLQWDAGASIPETAQEMEVEQKTAKGLLDALDYWWEQVD